MHGRLESQSHPLDIALAMPPGGGPACSSGLQPCDTKDNGLKGFLGSMQWQNGAQDIAFRQELFLKKNALLTGVVLI